MLGEAELSLALHWQEMLLQVDFSKHQVSLIQHYELSRVHIGRLEVNERLLEIKLVNKSDPATVKEELIALLTELRVTLINLKHEDFFGFLDLSHV